MIYVMIVVLVTNGFTDKVSVDAIVFETAERCLRNIPVVKKQLKADESFIECHAKNIEKGK